MRKRQQEATQRAPEVIAALQCKIKPAAPMVHIGSQLAREIIALIEALVQKEEN